MGANDKFQFEGINHLALVCRDMARTVAFYQGVLGMPLVKTIEIPKAGQHFFFDVGNGDTIAFFWFADAIDEAPGVAAPRVLPTEGDFRTAVGSMNHVAINVPAERFDEYYRKLVDAGVEVSDVLNHDDSYYGVAGSLTDDVFVRSVYFFDPDGILLEFASWTRPFRPEDVSHAPAREGDLPVGVEPAEAPTA